ncbi:MAG: hypothetical protein SVK08_11100 [Halobacteriota archaeon]|nr:hypothetical protein [Halobacteriota archaeon]
MKKRFEKEKIMMPYRIRVNKTRREYKLRFSVSVPKTAIRQTVRRMQSLGQTTLTSNDVDSIGSIDVPDYMLPFVEKKIGDNISEINDIEGKKRPGFMITSYKVAGMRMIDMTPEEIKELADISTEDSMYFVEIFVEGFCIFDCEPERDMPYV